MTTQENIDRLIIEMGKTNQELYIWIRLLRALTKKLLQERKGEIKR